MVSDDNVDRADIVLSVKLYTVFKLVNVSDNHLFIDLLNRHIYQAKKRKLNKEKEKKECTYPLGILQSSDLFGLDH